MVGQLGIVPERIEPGHPEQNGRLERLHRTLKAETATPPKANRRRQPASPRSTSGTATTSRGRTRPWDKRPPSLLIHAPFRSYPARISSPRVRSRSQVRSVACNGGSSGRETWYTSVRLSEVSPVGLLQQDERTWSIQFGPLLIGILDDHERRIDKTPVKVLPMSPSLTVTHVPGRTVRVFFGQLARIIWKQCSSSPSYRQVPGPSSDQA